MSWVTDIRDLLDKLKFLEIVDEGQVGVHLRKGRAVLHEKHYIGEELEKIVAEEKAITKEFGGKFRFIMPYIRKPKLPNGYGYKFTNGLPRHPKRYEKDKNLYPGFYWCIPILDSIYTDHNQERRIVSKAEDMVIVPTADGDNVALGFIMIQKIVDYYTAYTRGDDYEDLLRGEASSILAKLASGKTTNDWKDSKNYKLVAEEALKKLQEYTAIRWGVGVHSFSLNPVILNPSIIIGYGINNPTPSYVGGIGLGGAPNVPVPR